MSEPKSSKSEPKSTVHIPIKGKDYIVNIRHLRHDTLRFYPEKPIKQLIDGAPIDEAVKTAKSLGGDHTALHKIRRFRAWVVEGDTKRDIQNAPEKVRDEIRWELKKIKAQVTTLLKAAP